MLKVIEEIISKQQLNALVKTWDIVYFYNSNGVGDSYLALANESVECCNSSSLIKIRSWLTRNAKSWVFGYFGYDLKNQIEELESNNEDRVQFPESYFFVPETLIKISKSKEWEIVYGDFNENEIRQGNNAYPMGMGAVKVEMVWKNSKEDYLAKIRRILDHIQLGDIYEMNYCHEYFAENVHIDPSVLYEEVNRLTKAPFNAFIKKTQ